MGGYFARAQEKTLLLQKKHEATILAIETSCDESAAAVVRNGRVVLSNIVHSQIPMHEAYGGVVPEIASRQHVMSLPWVIDETIRQAGIPFAEIDAVAVTHGPGLVGALLTGVSHAKALAYGLDVPLVPVHHIAGHISANFITHPNLTPPFLCLVVSGGHSHLFQCSDYGVYALLGRTLDDAAGEAFDKAARVLGLGYPGGPKIDEAALHGNERAYAFPSPKTQSKYDVSFSGLKTSLINLVHKMNQLGQPLPVNDLAASFRRAVVDVLLSRAMPAAKEMRATSLVVAGGVAANALLRKELAHATQSAGIALYMPPLPLCTDNAAMIGSAAYFHLMRGEIADLTLNAVPSLPLVPAVILQEVYG